MRQPKFGSIATGARFERFKTSAQFRDGKFQNASPTPQLTEGATIFGVLGDFLFRGSKQGTPSSALPSQKTDLLNLDPAQDVLVWFGHSSYFIQVDGKKILVDPVLSGNASPLTFTTRSFKGSDVYTTDDIPPVDYLFITHDHWDHLDHPTIINLRHKIGKVITGLGVGAHFESWGYDPSSIIEKDWNEKEVLDDGFVVNTTPARHFSGRGFKRNTSLWLSFVLTTPSMKIYIGGDSGYDSHFASIGDTFGPIDLAILECGQYDRKWKYIHMLPDELIKAAADLRAKKVLPVHWGKFLLANHSWDDPIKQIVALAKDANLPLITPMIGETVDLKQETNVFTPWWESVKVGKREIGRRFL
jgi:L-ascorbate metabolism protein UlaG (beta-lactamase superfamily)